MLMNVAIIGGMIASLISFAFTMYMFFKHKKETEVALVPQGQGLDLYDSENQNINAITRKINTYKGNIQRLEASFQDVNSRFAAIDTGDGLMLIFNPVKQD